MLNLEANECDICFSDLVVMPVVPEKESDTVAKGVVKLEDKQRG